MYDCRGIYWCAKALGRLEPHLTGSGDGRFIQSMTQAAYHAIDVQLSIRAKQHLEQNFSFQLELAGFLRINRAGFGDDFDLRGGRAAIRLSYLGSAVRKFLRDAESSSLDGGASISIVALRNPVSETRAGDGTLDPLRSTGSVPVALAWGQIKRSQLGGRQMGIVLALSFQAVRIAESSGLYLLYGSADGRWS